MTIRMIGDATPEDQQFNFDTSVSAVGYARLYLPAMRHGERDWLLTQCEVEALHDACEEWLAAYERERGG